MEVKLPTSLRIHGYSFRLKLVFVYSSLSSFVMGLYFVIIQFYLLELGFYPSQIGALFTIGGVTSAILTLPSGIIADKIGRAKMVFISTLSEVIALFIIASSSSFLHQAIAQLFMGLGWSSHAALSALIADIERKERLSDAYTFSFFLNNMLIAFGSFLGFIPPYLQKLGVGVIESYRYPLYFIALIFSIGMVFLTPLLKEKREAKAGREWRITSWRLLWRLGLVNLLIGFGAGLTIPIFNVYFYLKFGVGPEFMGPLSGIGSLIMSFLSIYINEIGKVKGKVRTIVGVEVIAIALLLGIVASRSFLLAGLFFIMRYVLMNVSSPLIEAFIMERIAVGERATFMSLINLAWNLPNSGSTFIGGILLEKWVELPPLLTSSLYAVAVLIFYSFFRKEDVEHRLDPAKSN